MKFAIVWTIAMMTALSSAGPPAPGPPYQAYTHPNTQLRTPSAPTQDGSNNPSGTQRRRALNQRRGRVPTQDAPQPSPPVLKRYEAYVHPNTQIPTPKSSGSTNQGNTQRRSWNQRRGRVPTQDAPQPSPLTVKRYDPYTTPDRGVRAPSPTEKRDEIYKRPDSRARTPAPAVKRDDPFTRSDSGTRTPSAPTQDGSNNPSGTRRRS